MTRAPYYFANGSFVDDEGPEKFSGSREYRSLPGLNRVIVDRWTYTDLARRTWIPVSSLAAYTAGVRFEENLPPVSEWQFLDIETDKKSSFKLAVLNEKVFTNAPELVSEVLTFRNRFPVVCSYNGFRFDNKILGERLGLLPNIRFGDFTVYYFPEMLNVDLWYWTWHHYRFDAESKSLKDLCASEGYPVEWSKLRKYDQRRALEDNRMARWLADRIDVREAWKLMVQLTNCCPLALQTMHLDTTHRAILQSWYLSHGFLPLEYPDPGTPSLARGPVRGAVPGAYEDQALFDVKAAYPSRASSLQLRIYEEETPPAFTCIMREFLELTSQHPKQKPMLKHLANSLIGEMASNNNFLRRQNIYEQIVGGFAQEFANYLSTLPNRPVFVHTDGWLAPASSRVQPLNGYEVRVKHRYRWVIVYDAQKTLGVLDKEPPRVECRGFPKFSSSYPSILRWARDRFYEELASSNVERAKVILRDPRGYMRKLERRGKFRLPLELLYWRVNVWKESEIIPDRWVDPEGGWDVRWPLVEAWVDFELGPNEYMWPREWVEENR